MGIKENWREKNREKKARFAVIKRKNKTEKERR